MENNNSAAHKTNLACNDWLQEIIKEYGFEPYGVRGTKWRLEISNDSNCQSAIYLHLLRGNACVKVSIANEEQDFLHAIDMFSTDNMDKVRTFIDLIK